MKKLIIVITILLFFILGLIVGNTNSSYSVIFEDAKDEFEENIQIPDNSYQPKTLKPKENILNKFANFVDDIIDKVSDKLS